MQKKLKNLTTLVVASRLRPACIRTVLLLGPLQVALACGSEDLVSPAPGILAIRTSTTGPEPDPDGYVISMNDGADVAIGVNDTHQFTDLAAGSHTVRVGGMAANCVLEGENPRMVSVEAGTTTTVQLNVTCGPSTGSLRVTVSTTGVASDPDGYTITLDGADRGTLAASTELTIEALAAGNHVLGLSGVAANCQVAGENPRAVTVTAGISVTEAFTVTCAAPPPVAGSVRVTTTTTGGSPDTDGYTFAIDGGTSQPIGTNASVTVSGMAAGERTVILSGLAGNCVVQGANPRPVTVAAGATAEMTFSVSCSPAGTTGSLEITTATTGSSLDDGYIFTLDNGTAQPIGINQTVTIPEVSAGAHQIALAGIAPNCTVTGENPRLAPVTVGSKSTVNFDISCLAPQPSTSKIAFNSWNGGTAAIYVMNPDGSDLTALTPSGEDDRRPVWSPDRSKIAFTRRGELWTMNPDGGNRVMLTNRLGDGYGLFRWSPDGSKIVFRTNDEMVECEIDGQPNFCPLNQIWSMNADGTNLMKVADGTEPSWAPDSRRIAFVAEGQIQVANADGTGRRTLTNQPRRAHQPAWSPAGGRIAFVIGIQREQDVTEILVMNEDGSEVSNLTSGRGMDTEPLWSPNGTKIAFNTFDPLPQGSDDEVAVMNPDGTGRIVLTNNPATDVGPTWSPAGDRLAFMRKAFGEPTAIDVYVINADGSGERNLTNHPEIADDWPSWSAP